MSEVTHRALHVQRLLDSPVWGIAREVLGRAAKELEDDALNNEDPAKELMLLHRAQAARLILHRFLNALVSEAGATDADIE